MVGFDDIAPQHPEYLGHTGERAGAVVQKDGEVRQPAPLQTRWALGQNLLPRDVADVVAYLLTGHRGIYPAQRMVRLKHGGPLLDRLVPLATGIAGASPTPSPTPSPSLGLVMNGVTIAEDSNCAGCHRAENGGMRIDVIPTLAHPLAGWTKCTECHAAGRLVQCQGQLDLERAAATLTGTDVDRYGRLVARIRVGGVDVSEALVRRSSG